MHNKRPTLAVVRTWAASAWRDAHLERWAARSGSVWVWWPGVALVCGVLTAVVLVIGVRESARSAAHVLFFMIITGLLSLGVVALASWAVRRARLHGLLVRLLMPAVLAALVIALNVAVLSTMMFLSSADAGLLLGFLGFSVAVALTLTAPMIWRTARTIARMGLRAERIAAGDYETRLSEEPANEARELQRLAHSFDRMVAGVQDAVARRQMVEAQRLQFMSALSHDLRTPICCVQSMVEAIADGVVSDPEIVRQYHERLRGEVRRLSLLIGELFEISRLETASPHLERQHIALADVLAEIVEAAGERAEQADVTVNHWVSGELPPVAVDAEKMHWILSELLNNALRHTPAGGAIVVCAAAQARAGPAAHQETDQEQEILVRVIDTGEGIAAHDLAHVFEATYRGDPARQRRAELADGECVGCEAGLGLTLAKYLVEAHGGHIGVLSPVPAEVRELVVTPEPIAAASRPAPGTVVSFTIPLARAQ